MSDQDDWASGLSWRVGRRVAAHRRARDLSAQDLAELTAALGHEIKRGAIAHLENGRRGVTLADLLVLAAALGVPPLVLVLPIESSEPIDLLPALPVDPRRGALWWRGDAPVLGFLTDPEEWERSAELIELIARRHALIESAASTEGWSRVASEELRAAEGSAGTDPQALEMNRRLAASFSALRERDLRYLAELERDIERVAREERRRLGFEGEPGGSRGVD